MATPIAEGQARLLATLPVNNPSPVLILDRTGRVLYANAAAGRMLTRLGLDPRAAWLLLPTQLKHGIGGLAPAGAKRVWEYKIRSCALLCEVHADNEGHVHVYVSDITDRKKAEEVLRRIVKAVESASDAIGISDTGGKRLYQNPAYTRLFGYTVAELNAAGGPSAVYADRAVAQDVLKTIRRANSWSGEVKMRARDGRSLIVMLRADAIKDEYGEVIGLIGVHTDVTETRRAQERIRRLAYYDSLTGLPNYTFFHRRVGELTGRARQSHDRFATLILDLDNYKDINYTLGHTYGDELLRLTALRLRGVLEPVHTLAHFEEDEYGILLKQADEEQAVQTARALRRALADPFALGALVIKVDASIGISLYPEHGDSADFLLRRADVAMHYAHVNHVGVTVYAPQRDSYSHERLTLMAELQRAIHDDSLYLQYQPRIDLRSGCLSGVEALVRWRHPREGAASPSTFIPLAEQTELIKPLTEWIANAALRQAAEWRQNGFAPDIGINLSVRNLQDRELPQVLERLLRKWSIPPASLFLEITESALMTDPKRAKENVSRFAEMGMRLAIDDFGTGYSSLSYLKQLPVHELKIDQTFVRHMTRNDNDAMIVRSTVDLAHNLGLKVVAEGVEDRDSLELLKSLGCDTVQGYFLARPLSHAELWKWRGESPWGATPGRRTTTEAN